MLSFFLPPFFPFFLPKWRRQYFWTITFLQSYFCPGFINRQKKARKGSIDLFSHTQILLQPLTRQKANQTLPAHQIRHYRCMFCCDSLTLIFLVTTFLSGSFLVIIFWRNLDYIFLISIWKNYCRMCETTVQVPALRFIRLCYHVGVSDLDMRERNRRD